MTLNTFQAITLKIWSDHPPLLLEPSKEAIALSFPTITLFVYLTVQFDSYRMKLFVFKRRCTLTTDSSEIYMVFSSTFVFIKATAYSFVKNQNRFFGMNKLKFCH